MEQIIYIKKAYIYSNNVHMRHNNEFIAKEESNIQMY